MLQTILDKPRVWITASNLLASLRDGGSQKNAFVASNDYRWPTGRAIARSIGLGVDMKKLLCYKIARAIVCA